jgi:hypothetical protein
MISLSDGQPSVDFPVTIHSGPFGPDPATISVGITPDATDASIVLNSFSLPTRLLPAIATPGLYSGTATLSNGTSVTAYLTLLPNGSWVEDVIQCNTTLSPPLLLPYVSQGSGVLDYLGVNRPSIHGLFQNQNQLSPNGYLTGTSLRLTAGQSYSLPTASPEFTFNPDGTIACKQFVVSPVITYQGRNVQAIDTGVAKRVYITDMLLQRIG